MDILDRFLVREFLSYFILLLFGLALLYLGIDFLSNVWNLNLPMLKIFQLYSYKIPRSLEQFVPVATMMAVLLVLSSMSRQNEILALFTSGIGLLRICSTFVTITSIICTVSFLAFDALTPLFARKQILVSQGLDPSQEHLLSFGRSRFWYRNGNLLYNVGSFATETNTLEEINSYKMDPSFNILEMIHSKRARFVGDTWIFENGFMVTYPMETPYPISTTFEKKRGAIREKPPDFVALKFAEETMPLKDLRKYIERNRSYGSDTTHQSVAYHERLAHIFTPLIFVLLAIPYATKPLRTQPIPRSIGFCFITVFVYLLMIRMFLSVGKGGHLPAVVAGWAPNALFLGFSVFAILRRQHA